MNYRTTIAELFNPKERHFAVPNYQRAYSWDTDKHVNQFLRDLKEHPSSVAQYHFGHFLFELDNTSKNKYWLIDGQQRMTTAIIFLSCINNRLKILPEYNEDSSKLYEKYLVNTDGQQKFCTVDYDNNFLLNVIITNKKDTIDTRSRRRLKEAFDFLQTEVDKSSIEELLHWKNLMEGAKITTDTVEDKAEATQIFTFQNDRGKDLTNLEKLKAFLMLQIFLGCKTTGSSPESAIRFIEKEFEYIYKSLEKLEMVNEDQVLSYHVNAFLAISDNSLDRVKHTILSLQNSEHQKWINNFIVDLKRSFEFAILIQDKRKDFSYIADVLFLDQPNSFPLILKLYHHHQEAEKIETILRLTEIILFRLKYTNGNYYSNYLPNIALHYNGSNLEALKDQLMNCAKNGFKNYWNFESDFYSYLEGSNHYFGLTRYLLWKYENSLRESVKEPPMLFPEFNNLYGKAKFENTIDHWAPQKPIDKEYSQEFVEKYLHNIGNMVLSTRGRNASDSNNSPEDKSTSSILISRQRLEGQKADWTPEHIKKRQEHIVEFAKKYWNPDIVN